jgi:hypothetical protein
MTERQPVLVVGGPGNANLAAAAQTGMCRFVL